MLVSSAYANRNYWTRADGEDGAVSDFDGRAGGNERAAGADARWGCARAGRARGEIGGTFSAEESDVRDGGVCGHWRTAKRSREGLGVAGSVARSGRADARGADVRRCIDAASGGFARRGARH